MELFKIPKSVIVVHGWQYLTNLLLVFFANLKGHTVCMRGDTPLNQENLKSGWTQKMKYLFLKYVLFPGINYYLYVGTQNRLFYKSYNISDKQLIDCPYGIDNEHFNDSIYDINAIKKQLNIPENAKIILFSAKYINKKRPMDLLQAFKKINSQNCWLLMVGEGILRKNMEEFIRANQLNNVLLTGFVNQSAIGQYYAISNVFVMCSTIGETWGLSVNEAMHYNLPVVVSDLTGCANDLVAYGVNGYTFKTGDVDELTVRLKDVLDNKLSWTTSSKEIIKRYSYETIVENIKCIL